MYKYHYVFRSDSACNSYNLVKKIDDLKALKFIKIIIFNAPQLHHIRISLELLKVNFYKEKSLV